MNLMQIRRKHNTTITQAHRETNERMIEHVRLLIAELPIPATEVFVYRGRFFLRLASGDSVDHTTIRSWTMPYGARPSFSLDGCPSKVLEDLALAFEWWGLHVVDGVSFQVYPKSPKTPVDIASA